MTSGLMAFRTSGRLSVISATWPIRSISTTAIAASCQPPTLARAYASAGPATLRPSTPWRSMNEATSPLALASSTKACR